MNYTYIRKSSDAPVATILQNKNGDTRVSNGVPDKRSFMIANNNHRGDVRAVMNVLSRMVMDAGEKHDWTKTQTDMSQAFYNDFTATKNGTLQNFEDGWWYRHHVTLERHHLDKHAPYDVNLIDVIEMITDQVCAYKARNPEGNLKMNIPQDVLESAVRNTYELINKMTVAMPADLYPAEEDDE